MAVQTVTRTQTYIDLDVQSFSFIGKGKKARPRKGDYRPTFYVTVDGVRKGRVRITRLASGKGFSVQNLGVRVPPVYLADDADVVLFYKNGTVDTVTLVSAWDYWSQQS
jgi:hypothetical protein